MGKLSRKLDSLRAIFYFFKEKENKKMENQAYSFQLFQPLVLETTLGTQYSFICYKKHTPFEKTQKLKTTSNNLD